MATPSRLESIFGRHYHYDLPFRFTGKLNKVTFELGPQQMTPDEQKTMAVKGQRDNPASE
jgi:hypothetical protein